MSLLLAVLLQLCAVRAGAQPAWSVVRGPWRLSWRGPAAGLVLERRGPRGRWTRAPGHTARAAGLARELLESLEPARPAHAPAGPGDAAAPSAPVSRELSSALRRMGYAAP